MINNYQVVSHGSAVFQRALICDMQAPMLVCVNARGACVLGAFACVQGMCAYMLGVHARRACVQGVRTCKACVKA